jgi:MFS transporter, MHS family, proline/betaine transporter
MDKEPKAVMNKVSTWKTLILGCSVGNVLELYDFILYAYFSSTLGLLFFPTDNTFIATMLAFSVFAIGCLMRPIGAIIFGIVGDKLGRRKALLLSIGMMTFATCFIGILPTYATIGLFAPLLLLTSRLIQGLSMSGEEVGAAIYLMENAPNEHRCLAGSIILGGVYLGLMMASIVALITISTMDQRSLHILGWRIPFLLSSIFGIIALYIRIKQPETCAFKQIRSKHKIAIRPIRSVIKYFYLNILKTTLVASLLAVLVYLYAVYLPSYISLNFKFGLSGTMIIGIVSFFITTAITIITGMVADSIGYHRVMQLASISVFIFIYPMFVLLSSHTLFNAIISEFLLSCLVGMTAGSLMPFFVDSFPTALRFAGSAIAFNLSMTIFGSSAPIIILYLLHHTQSVLPATFYVMMIAALTFAASLSFKTTETGKCYA